MGLLLVKGAQPDPTPLLDRAVCVWGHKEQRVNPIIWYDKTASKCRGTRAQRSVVPGWKSIPRMRVVIIILALSALAPGAPAQTVNVWLTTHDQSSKLEPQPAVMFAPGAGGDNPLVVDETQTFQQVEGFGASFTDSAAYLLNQVATSTARSNAMNSLFTRNGGGIGVSFVRNPMGGSDLARFHYSYDDNPPGGNDPGLVHFSIAHD